MHIMFGGVYFAQENYKHIVNSSSCSVLLTGIYRVNQGEEGLILTFGEITARKQPGTIGYRLPIVQKLIKINN